MSPLFPGVQGSLSRSSATGRQPAGVRHVVVRGTQPRARRPLPSALQVRTQSSSRFGHCRRVPQRARDTVKVTFGWSWLHFSKPTRLAKTVVKTRVSLQTGHTNHDKHAVEKCLWRTGFDCCVLLGCDTLSEVFSVEACASRLRGHFVAWYLSRMGPGCMNFGSHMTLLVCTPRDAVPSVASVHL